MRRTVLCGVGALGAVALVTVAPVSVSAGTGGTTLPSGNVIVVLEQQHTTRTPRTAR
jgi:hypothetical protein